MAVLTQYWRMLLVRGIAALVFGILAIVWPDLTVVVLVLLFGAYALVDGVSVLIAVLTKSDGTAGRRGWLTVIGIVSVASGLVTFAWPGITALVLLYVIASWAIVKGVVEMVVAVRYRREMRREWLLALVGVLSVAFGLSLMVWPGDGALALTWVIGWFAIMTGVVVIGEGLRVRRLDRTVDRIIGAPSPIRSSRA
jgi:uncharacterized membrane protein HdeD (DUF308 family)